MNQSRLVNGVYEIREKTTQRPYSVYCDFTSEPGSVWTLIQSMAYSKAANFKLRSYAEDNSINEANPNFDNYKMSRDQIETLKTTSTHWRITCNLQPTGAVDYNDYVRGRMNAIDITNYVGKGICKTIEFIGIRGHQFTNCNIPWWQKKGQMLHTDPTHSRWKKCVAPAIPHEVTGEDNFGFYAVVDPKHSCVASPTSTTNTWIGRYI